MAPVAGCVFRTDIRPKDVSIACLIGGDHRIRAWWDEAVRETLKEIEAVTATRVRRRCRRRSTTGNMVAAVVTRGEPQARSATAHPRLRAQCHFRRHENRWKSVQPSGFYQHQGFYARCAKQLAEKLLGAGYELDPARGIGFTIKGIPPALRERFSQRRAPILREAAAAGAVSQDAIQTIVSNSRDAKVNATAADLRAGWLRAAGAEIDALRAVVTAADGTRPFPPGPETAAALTGGGAHLFERQSVVDERDAA